jgi:hypothetical protein
MGVGVGMSGRMVEGVAEGQEKAATKEGGSVFTAQYFKALDDEIADVQRRLEKAMEVLLYAENGVEKLKQKIKLAVESGNYSPAQKENDLITLSRFQSSRDEATAEARLLKHKLDGLIAARKQAIKPVPRPDEPKTVLERIDQRLEDLRLRWQTVENEAKRLKADADLAAKRFELLAEERKVIDEMVASLMAQRNALVGKKPVAVAKNAGRIEVVIRGSAAQYEFVFREFDASGTEVGTAVFHRSGAALLAKVLARTKADPSAPTELRVLASPPTALGGGPHAALNACDAAGYKTVKFTGYVVGGGFTQELKIDDTGEKPGYKRYDGTERKVTELMKEIEDGMRTF